EAGMRIEPPPILPWAAATSPAATAAAAPPLEPPAVHPGRHGLRVGGPSAVSQYREQPNSLVAVLPRLMVPAARKAATTSSSYSGTKSVNASEPYVVRTPRVACRSLIATGTPSSGGGYSSLASRSSAARACAVAASGVTVTKAPSRLLCASIRARQSATNSVELISRRLSAAAWATRVRSCNSPTASPYFRLLIMNLGS